MLQVSRLREDHLAADPEAKWPLLTVARLREAQSRLGLLAAGPEHERAVEEVRPSLRASFDSHLTLL